LTGSVGVTWYIVGVTWYTVGVTWYTVGVTWYTVGAIATIFDATGYGKLV